MIGVYHISGIDAKIIARNYYDGTIHVSWENGETFGIAEKVRTEGNKLSFILPEPVAAEVVLEIAGIMSDRPLTEVNECLEAAKRAAFDLGVNRGIDPFMTLSFMALPVIPKLRITTRGVYDVNSQQYI